MASILTHEIITKASDTVDSYISTAGTLYQELEGVIDTLTTNNFIGDASNGYKTFFLQKVTPALTENLTAPTNSLMSNIKAILENIQTQLLDTVDPKLGENNQDPGSAAE